MKLDNLHKFGSKVHIVGKTKAKDKFVHFCWIFEGYPGDRKAYGIWVPAQKSIILSRYVKFHEVKIQEREKTNLKFDPFELEQYNWITDKNQPVTVDVEYISLNMTISAQDKSPNERMGTKDMK